MRRLIGKLAVCEQRVDLLSNHVFVDLYQVVWQGIVIGMGAVQIPVVMFPSY